MLSIMFIRVNDVREEQILYEVEVILLKPWLTDVRKEM